MKYFERAELTSSRQPILQSNELILIRQGNVGIYEKQVATPSSPHLLLYILCTRFKTDRPTIGNPYALSAESKSWTAIKMPVERAVELPLAMVREIEGYGRFLRASPKVILHLQSGPALSINDNNSGSSSSSSSSSNNNKCTTPVGSWVCPICSFSNASNLEKCQLCGVRRRKENESSSSSPMPAPASLGETDSSVCRMCTFINHPSMIQCEVCGADLAVVDTPLIKKDPVVLEEDAHVRIAFRNGGYPGFLAKIKEAFTAKAWTKTADPPVMERNVPILSRGAGISAVQERIEKSKIEAQETMQEAFQDLDNLMSKATAMVSLAESISAKMARDPNKSDSDLSTLRTYFLNLGISDPVTRDSAGSIYHQELARELAEFLQKFLDQQDTMKPLTDLYCIFNRARGVELISPEDLYKAIQQFEVLKLPFRLRKFSSGLLVVQSLYMNDDRASEKVLRRVKEQAGCHITALRLAELEDYSLALATEHLMIAEQKGLVCRDQGPTGLIFYENVFLQQTQ
ncbi:EAP30/Vps36 family-domain-containing protein [Dichotomocladium elegans]|nr:EAP30/Vps36 family-domain-containing protein [Dichotomocladium elegans]